MELRIEDTVVQVSQEAADGDPMVSIRPLSEQPTLATELPQLSTLTSQRTMPRISIDLGERTAAAHQGADLEVTGLLGEGGMGRVLLARQHTLQRDVAVKVLRDEASDHHHAALLEEGAIVGSLEHPVILPVHALGLDDRRRPILVMKRIEGVPLSELLNDQGHALWEQRASAEERLTRGLEILIQICNAVQFAHDRGVLHLDIKPSNIMVGHHGEIYLVDWGVARRLADTRVGFAGTPASAAPEMVAGEQLDARTDVYLLGSTLHTLLTGEPRHRGETVMAVFAAAVQSEAYDYADDVPPELAELARRATTRDAAERPESADRFRRALVDFLEHRASAALARSALGRIEELKSLLRSEQDDNEVEDSGHLEELLVEARFALKQALKLWPDNPDAKQGSAALTELRQDRQEQLSKLRRIAQEHDKSLSARQRTLTTAAMCLGAITATGVAIAQYVAGTERTLTELTIEGAIITTIAMVMLGYFRRAFTRNYPNRVAALTLIVATWSVLLSRILGLLAGASLAEVMTRDCFIGGVIVITMAMASSRWYLLVTGLCLGCGALATLRPDTATMAFAIASGVSITLVTLIEFVAYTRQAR